MKRLIFCLLAAYFIVLPAYAGIGENEENPVEEALDYARKQRFEGYSQQKLNDAQLLEKQMLERKHRASRKKTKKISGSKQGRVYAKSKNSNTSKKSSGGLSKSGLTSLSSGMFVK